MHEKGNDDTYISVGDNVLGATITIIYVLQTHSRVIGTSSSACIILEVCIDEYIFIGLLQNGNT